MNKPVHRPPKEEFSESLPPVAETPWQSVESLPKDPDAVFHVRSNPKATPVAVRYRKSRAINPQNGKWEPFLKIVDLRTGMKIPFKPSEWKPA